MKNINIILLCTITALLAALLGIFVGRNLPDNRTELQEHTVQTNTRADESLGKININTATKDQLILLPGIGETIAQRIIIYRQENGNFSNIIDLQNVVGIGKQTLSKILDYITVGG